MIKVVSIVLNNFQHDSRVLKEAISLQKAGYGVRVVALHEEHLAENEIVQNIQVNRIKLATKYWHKSKPVQLIKYLEFLVRVAKQYRNADIFHCNHLNALPVGVLIKLFYNKKVKVVYDAHEYQVNEIPYQSKISIKLLYYIEMSLIKYADAVITVSASITNEYQRLYSIPKPGLVLNCPNYVEVEKQDHFRKQLGIRPDQKIFLYQGGLCAGRGIELLIEAFSVLDSDKSVIVFMGYGELEAIIQRHASLHNTIYFLKAVAPDILLNYTAAADYGILFYENSCLNHDYCSPNKMFEYIMAGLPVITSNLFEMRRLVENYKLGIVAEENSIKGFLQAVTRLLALDYKSIVSNVYAARKIFNWEAQEKILIQVYKGLNICAE